MIFVLSIEEVTTYREWEKNHKETCGKTKRLKTNNLAFIFRPTSLGDCITVKCEWCKEEKDLTDYKSW